MTDVLVTGANSGIGAAAVIALLERGASVVATVRTESAARQVRHLHRGRDITVALLDVTDSEAAARVMSRHRPDVVINSAGDAVLGAIMDINDEAARDQFDALVIGPTRLARLLVDHHRPGRAARVVNVSSTMGSVALPFTGWYGAAKAALDSTTNTLRLELAPTGIDVVLVECGAVDTPAWDHAGHTVRDGADPATTSSRRRWSALTAFARPVFADPSEVGKVIARAALDPHPRPIYRVGFGSGVARLSSLIPTRLENSLLKQLFGLKPRSSRHDRPTRPDTNALLGR